MKFTCAAICGLFCIGCLSWIASAAEKQIVGWVERACLEPENVVLAAKADTGADNSSLNAPYLTEFTKGGEPWVRFEVIDENGRSVTFQRKVVRVAKIKRHVGRGQERPVVMMGIRLGKLFKEVEVDLVDRSRFKYQLLLGRNFMSGLVLVDPDLQYTIEPVCHGTKDQ